MRPSGHQGDESPLGDAVQDSSNAPWGHQLDRLASESLREIGLNVNTIPQDSQDGKNVLLRSFINEKRPDVLGMSELNVAWHRVPLKHRLGERFKEWFPESRVHCAWYRKYPRLKGARQPGGTAIAVFGSTCHRIDKFGHDSSGLGRWAWVRLRGKNGTHQRIISAYRPVKNDYPFSTYTQQWDHLNKNKRKEEEVCPREQFVQDLSQEILKFREEDEEIHLLLDDNDDLCQSNSLVAIALGAQDIRKTILDQHGYSGLLTGDFYLTLVVPQKSEYLVYVNGLSAHCPVFVELLSTEVFGQGKVALKKFAGRRLKVDDSQEIQSNTHQNIICI